MDGCVRRQLSAGKKVRRQWQRRSGFAAALVDVVLHQGDDLLQFVVQLGATRRGVGLQSAHHLGGREASKPKSKKCRLAEYWCVCLRKSATCPDAESLNWMGGGQQQQPLLLRPFDTLPSTRQKPPSCIYKKTPHLRCYSRPIVVTRVSGDLRALSGGVLAGRAG